jgi:hypothetical protein
VPDLIEENIFETAFAVPPFEQLQHLTGTLVQSESKTHAVSVFPIENIKNTAIKITARTNKNIPIIIKTFLFFPIFYCINIEMLNRFLWLVA